MSAETPVVVHSREQEWLPLLNLAAQEVFEVMLGSPLGTATKSETPAGENLTAMVGLAGSLRELSHSLAERIRPARLPLVCWDPRSPAVKIWYATLSVKFATW